MKPPKCKKVTAYVCPYCDDLHSSEARANRCRDQSPVLFQQFQVLSLKSQKANKSPVYWIVLEVEHLIDPKNNYSHEPAYTLEKFPSDDVTKQVKNKDFANYEIVPVRALALDLKTYLAALKRIYSDTES